MTTTDPQSRRVGMALGAGIGDALAQPLARAAQGGPTPASGVTGYAELWPGPEAPFAPYGAPTQQAVVILWALVESLREGWSLDATQRRIAEGLLAWAKDTQGRAGRSEDAVSLAGAAALAEGALWFEAGDPEAADAGAAARAWPFAVALRHDPERAEAWAVAHAKLTHRHPAAGAACAAVVRAGVAALEGASPEALGEAMAATAGRHHPPAEAALRAVLAQGTVGPDLAFPDPATAVLARALAGVLARPDDYPGAVLHAANLPEAPDALASITGALVGARVGRAGLPDAWVGQLERAHALEALVSHLGSGPIS